jgi:hypothetical protein
VWYTAYHCGIQTGRIFMKLHIWVFFENLWQKFQFLWNLAQITSTLHRDLRTFMILFQCIVLTIGDVSEKVVRKIRKHFMFNNFFPKLCRFSDNVEKYGRVGEATYDNIIWHMYFACRTTKATDTCTVFHGNSGYTISPQCYVIHTLPVLLFIIVSVSTLYCS